MGNELWDTLLRFHREVAKPEIVGELREELSETIASLGREMRLGEMRSELHALTQRLASLEQEFARLANERDASDTSDEEALREEIEELKENVALLKQRIEELERKLQDS